MYVKVDSKMSKFSKKSVATRKIVQNQLMKKEISYLKSLVPTLNTKSNPSKLLVINETVRYIEQLEKEVLRKWAHYHQQQLSMNNDQRTRLVVIKKPKKNQHKIIEK